MQFRALDLTRDDDFATLRSCIGALYSELFGASAVPSEATFEDMREQSATSAVPHWSFVGERQSSPSPGDATSDASGDTTDDQIMTFVTLAESFAVFAEGRYAIIGELWVHPAHRSQGVGAQVIAFCGEFARKQGYKRLDVSAPPDAKWDRTFEFYRTQGLVWTGRKLKLLLR